MSNWTNIWVNGYRPALEAFIEAKRVDDGYGGLCLPHGIFVVGYIAPQVTDGVDTDGNPRYKPKAGNVKYLWLFSLHGDKATLIDELKLLQNPVYTIHENATLEQMQQLYPEHCLGQGIPHIATIQGESI